MNRSRLLAVASAVAAVIVVLAAIWLFYGGLSEFVGTDSRQVAATVGPTPVETMTAAEVTRVVEVAAQNVTNVRLGDQSVSAVSAGGAILAAAPAAVTPAESPAPGGPATPAAPRIQTDPLRGVAVVIPQQSSTGGVEGSTLLIGSSKDLQSGQQLIVAPGPGLQSVSVTYTGMGETELEAFGLIQYVLDLQLPPGVSVREGAVLDGKGALVGIVVPDRQKGVRPGHVFAVPIEQAKNLIAQSGATRRDQTPVPGSIVPEGPGKP